MFLLHHQNVIVPLVADEGSPSTLPVETTLYVPELTETGRLMAAVSPPVALVDQEQTNNHDVPFCLYKLTVNEQSYAPYGVTHPLQFAVPPEMLSDASIFIVFE